MNEIEIYEKVLKIVKEEDFHEASLALSFVSRKIESDHYAKQHSNGYLSDSCIQPVACGSNSVPVPISRQSSKFEATEQQTENSDTSVPETE